MLFSRADIKGRPHVDSSGPRSVPRYVQYNRSQLTHLTTPSRLWTATSHRQRRLPPTGSVNPAPSPQRFHRKCATAFAQRKLGNGVCGSLRLLSENSTALERSLLEGNACWTMKSSKSVSICACAAKGARVQLHKGREAKHHGCRSPFAGTLIGAFFWHRFPGTVGGCFFLRPRLPSGARCRGTQAPWEGMAGAYSLGAGTCVELVTKGPGST